MYVSTLDKYAGILGIKLIKILDSFFCLLNVIFRKTCLLEELLQVCPSFVGLQSLKFRKGQKVWNDVQLCT